MKQLAFVTDGAIDLRSFTTFGFNSKPNTTSPIGFFGTGLKIATAVIARLGCKMTVMIDGVQHEFYTKETDFRGKSFDLVRMRKRKGMMSRWQYQEMPYTTELGKNWEAWQVFRELESNTRDENGETFLLPDGYELSDEEVRGKTIILIDEPSVIEAYEERDTIFLPTDLELRTESDRCQAFNVGSKYLFYRGMRVMELHKPSAFTYNIVAEQRLTEDRTLYNWSAAWEVRQLIMESTDLEFVEQIIQLDEENFWESKIEFDDVYAASSPTFRSAVGERKTKGLPTLSRVLTFYDRYNPPADPDPEVTVTLRRSKWQRIYQVLNEVDTYDLAPSLGWEEEDDRFDAFVELRDLLFTKAPVDDGVDFVASKKENEDEKADAPRSDSDDDIPF